MRNADALEAITLSTGVAEQERAIETFFIETPAFRQIVRGEADLVLGAKGSGKTAISRVLGTRGAGTSELSDTLMVNAFATHASGLFANLPEEIGEEEFRRIWLAFFAAAAGDKVASVVGVRDRDALLASMRHSDLSERITGAQRDLMRTLVESISVPERASGAGPKWASPGFPFESTFTQLDNLLSKSAKRCWILLDRLDEAFPPNLEEPALRGLLRAHADLQFVSEKVRTKIFLRSDIFEKVTQNAGFPGLDHLSDVTLRWTRASLLRLLAARIRSSAGHVLGVHSDEPSEMIVRRLMPQSVSYENDRRRQTRDAFDWCISVSSATQNEPSPRNLVRLLREAQGLAIDRLVTSEDDRPYQEPLLLGADLLEAWHLLSKRRLVDTIFAERNHLRPFVQTFFRQSARASVETMTTAFMAVEPACFPGRTISDLEGIGFLHRAGPELYEVSPLYRPALEIDSAVTKRPEDFRITVPLSAASPERTRDSAKELVSQGLLPGAIRILVEDSNLNEKNLAYAANLAIESRDPDLIRDVDSVMSSSQYASAIVGRRAAFKYARGHAPLAHELMSSLPLGDTLDEALGQFVGTLSNDHLFEYDVWYSLIQARPWDNPKATPWTLQLPVLSASRLLPVAWGRGRLPSFADDVSAVFTAWYGEPSRVPIEHLQKYLEIFRRRFEAPSPQLRPYQVVSLLRVLELAGWKAEEVHNEVIAKLATRLRSSELEHQQTFRRWAAMDPIAAIVLQRADL